MSKSNPSVSSMRELNIYCVVLVLNLAWVSTSHAQDTATINKTVTECLKVVHSLADDYAKYFDAFYNPATGKVENNVIYATGRSALFQFNKCMAQHGVPLK